MSVVEIVLSGGALAFGASVAYAVWRTLPNPDDAQPDMKLVRQFVASTPQKELRNIMAPRD